MSSAPVIAWTICSIASLTYLSCMFCCLVGAARSTGNRVLPTVRMEGIVSLIDFVVSHGCVFLVLGSVPSHIVCIRNSQLDCVFEWM